MIRLGYVGLNTMLPTPSKTFRLSSYSDEKMLTVARENIAALRNVLLWNIEHQIKVFRITSQLIPFGSHPINSGIWKKHLQQDLINVGKIIKESSMRVSMHPGQYTVLNSPNEIYYKNALADLEYHAAILELMDLDTTHRFVIHGGGGYGNKDLSLKMLKQRIKKLPENIYQRLMLENDDVVFSAEDILNVCLETKVPGVLDVFHHEVFPSLTQVNIKDLILMYKKTWSTTERQKIQYSNQDKEKSKGAHSQSIDLEEFKLFYDQIQDLDFDIMLEVKDKEQSVLNLRKHFPSIQ